MAEQLRKTCPFCGSAWLLKVECRDKLELDCVEAVRCTECNRLMDVKPLAVDQPNLLDQLGKSKRR